MSDVVEPPSWPILDSEPGPDLRIFRVRLDRVENPRSGHRFRAIVLETPDWVNVVARTDSGDVVMVRQFRFGVRAVTLEIPGGMIEPGEDPEAAAARELLEETGYVAARWTSLGWVEPNPAFHENRCFSFLAEGARQVSAPTPDLGEDLRVTRLSEAEVRRQVNDGKIRHSLVLCALARVFDLRPPL